MQDLTENSVTEVALAQMASTADPRLREIMASLVHRLQSGTASPKA